MAALSLPSYLHRNIRLQIEGALPLADIPKARVAEQYALLQTFPADNAAAGLLHFAVGLGVGLHRSESAPHGPLH